MSDVRPELQQIREALDYLYGKASTAEIADGAERPWIETDGQKDDALAALARVEASLNAQREDMQDLLHDPVTWREETFRMRMEAAEARVVAAERERDQARSMSASDLSMMEGYRTEAIISERRVVAAEAERDEWKAKYEAGDGQRPSSVEGGQGG